ncbi:MAG: ACT domain-containing protein [Lentisphaeria bacterium]|nr:ACT domain-containing protein [Lentisphaeria bacterium]
MKQIKQLSLFVENRKGALAEVCRVLKAAQVNILAATVADTSEFGILRLLTDDIAKSNAALKEAGFITSENNVLAICVSDKAGGLSTVFDATDRLGLSVEYMYAIPDKMSEKAIIVFRFDDQDSAAEKLASEGIELLDAEDIAR